jgi:hypothetical protein
MLTSAGFWRIRCVRCARCEKELPTPRTRLPRNFQLPRNSQLPGPNSRACEVCGSWVSGIGCCLWECFVQDLRR